MIKAAGKADANTEFARAFERPRRTPTHEHGELFSQNAQKKIGNANVCSDARARKSGAARSLIIHVCRHAPMATSM